MYNEPITQVSSAKHVGIVLDTSLKTMERALNACRSLRGTVMSMLRTGVHPAVLNPLVCAKIIRQVCYPKALYGCELWGELSKTETLMLERTHRYICKIIQGLQLMHSLVKENFYSLGESVIYHRRPYHFVF